VWTLADRQQAGAPDVSNSFAEPERMALVQSQIRGESGQISYRFPALTLTVLER
jgi:hypothetical protein